MAKLLESYYYYYFLSSIHSCAIVAAKLKLVEWDDVVDASEIVIASLAFDVVVADSKLKHLIINSSSMSLNPGLVSSFGCVTNRYSGIVYNKNRNMKFNGQFLRRAECLTDN